jgi:hypothetical protein
LEASLTYKGKVLATISDVIQKEKWRIMTKINKNETKFNLTFFYLKWIL